MTFPVSSLADDLDATRLPVRTRSRMARTLEVCGQCSTCLDFFSVSLYFTRGAWHVAETPRLKWSTRVLTHEDGTVERERILRHLPAYCASGKVHLYGSQTTLNERADSFRLGLRVRG